MISILVPVYNVAPYIERCARSLFEQSYKYLEFIFVNDCTPDDSISILKNVINDYPGIEKKIQIINHPRNMGLAAARNTAVRAANGEYIIHVDSDDYLDKFAIENLYKNAIANSSELVICDFMFVNSNGCKVQKNEFHNDKSEYIHSLITRKSLVNIIGMFIKKDLLVNNDLWEIEGLNTGEDYLMTPRIAYLASKISKVDKPLYYYNRTNVASYTANITDNSVNQIIEVQDRLIKYLSDLNQTAEFRLQLEESCIYNKITLLYCAPLSSFKKISILYNDIDWNKFNLKIKHRIVLRMIKSNWLRSVYYMIKAAKIIGL